jgi:hypothetical protein
MKTQMGAAAAIGNKMYVFGGFRIPDNGETACARA